MAMLVMLRRRLMCSRAHGCQDGGFAQPSGPSSNGPQRLGLAWWRTQGRRRGWPRCSSKCIALNPPSQPPATNPAVRSPAGQSAQRQGTAGLITSLSRARFHPARARRTPSSNPGGSAFPNQTLHTTSWGVLFSWNSDWWGRGFAQRRLVGQFWCWSEQPGAPVRCPPPRAMKFDSSTATRDICPGCVAPTESDLTSHGCQDPLRVTK
jgi:hypothetical protein